MKAFLYLCVLLISCAGTKQQKVSTEEAEVLEVFEAFFASMGRKDTVSLKQLILVPSPHTRFFASGSNEKEQLVTSSSSFPAFLNTVGNPDGEYGKCANVFENLSVTFYRQYAVVTSNYRCFIDEPELNHCGIYTIQFLKKRGQWQIWQVHRFITYDCQS